jgi:hypothetical protein
MKYKHYTITPFWTTQTKFELLEELLEKDLEIEKLKEELKSEKEYSSSVLKCSEKLQDDRNYFRTLCSEFFNSINEETIVLKKDIDSYLNDSIKQILKFWKT